MRATKKEEQLILDIYRRVYAEIGVDLESFELGLYAKYEEFL